MVSVSKALVDELIRDIVDHSLDTWWREAVWHIRVWFILIEGVYINAIRVVLDCGFDGDITSLEVM